MKRPTKLSETNIQRIIAHHTAQEASEIIWRMIEEERNPFIFDLKMIDSEDKIESPSNWHRPTKEDYDNLENFLKT